MIETIFPIEIIQKKNTLKEYVKLNNFSKKQCGFALIEKF